MKRLTGLICCLLVLLMCSCNGTTSEMKKEKVATPDQKKSQETQDMMEKSLEKKP
jgi:hypothetical protein